MLCQIFLGIKAKICLQHSGLPQQYRQSTHSLLRMTSAKQLPITVAFIWLVIIVNLWAEKIPMCNLLRTIIWSELSF